MPPLERSVIVAGQYRISSPSLWTFEDGAQLSRICGSPGLSYPGKSTNGSIISSSINQGIIYLVDLEVQIYEILHVQHETRPSWTDDVLVHGASHIISQGETVDLIIACLVCSQLRQSVLLGAYSFDSFSRSIVPVAIQSDSCSLPLPKAHLEKCSWDARHALNKDLTTIIVLLSLVQYQRHPDYFIAYATYVLLHDCPEAIPRCHPPRPPQRYVRADNRETSYSDRWLGCRPTN